MPPAFRNDVLRSKKVLIGCGGGYHQECSQPYSPVAKWIEEVDVALNDEGQQYGNLDEASAIARTPRKCIIIWCGDHKQTPGGLRKTDEAKAFRRKLLRRPIALGGDTEYIQPNLLGKVVLRYLVDVDDPAVKSLWALLLELLVDVCRLTLAQQCSCFVRNLHHCHRSAPELDSVHVKFIQLRSLGISKTETQQETLKSDKN